MARRRTRSTAKTRKASPAPVTTTGRAGASRADASRADPSRAVMPTERRAAAVGRAEDGAAEPAGLSVTRWFDPGTHGEPYRARIRFSGRRIGTRGKPGSRDTFVQEETVDRVVPGSGPVSVTTWVYGVEPGEWTVSADLIRQPLAGGGASAPNHWARIGAESLSAGTWSWRRWALRPAADDGPLKTRWAPLVRLAAMPAVIPGSWIGLVALGVAVGLILQAAILARDNVSVGTSLLVTGLVLVLGLLGAKVWYIAQHRRTWRQSMTEGWSVDGFLVVGPLVAIAALLTLKVPIGLFVDASTPALFIGIAIGRLGCFFTGCCAGRCTRSGWGVWSSDRRVGARRLPTQLLESVTGLLIGLGATLLLLGLAPAVHGAIFVAGFAVYVLVRQVLLGLRAEPHDPMRMRLTAIGAAVVLVAAVAALVVMG